MNWYPHVTVAVVIERDGRFLMVEEEQDGETVINQPAGHLDPNESLIEAAIRETLEETKWLVQPTALIDISLYTSPSNNVTYHRTTFAANAIEEQSQRELDKDIIRAVWLSLNELKSGQYQLRSPMVTFVIERYLQNTHYPLDLLSTYNQLDINSPHR